MIKPAEIQTPKPNPNVIPMSQMKPLQVGVIRFQNDPLRPGFTLSGRINDGHIIMRTADKDRFEVMDLSNPMPDGCWNGPASIFVELLPPGTKITIEVA